MKRYHPTLKEAKKAFMAPNLTKGQEIVFTKSLDGICKINKGDKAVYLGGNQAKIISGPSKDWVVYLDITAPVALTS